LEKLEKKYYTAMRSEAYLDGLTYLLFSIYNTMDIYTHIMQCGVSAASRIGRRMVPDMSGYAPAIALQQ
jgi:hypothetical protein